jgi:hypothetical protein
MCRNRERDEADEYGRKRVGEKADVHHGHAKHARRYRRGGIDGNAVEDAKELIDTFTSFIN